MTFYTIRITPDSTLCGSCFDDVVDVLKGIPNIPKMVVCREMAGKEHLHVHLYTQQSKSTVDKFKRKYFPWWNHTGNTHFALHSCEGCTKHPECSKMGLFYTCKDGDVVFSRGYTDEEIESFCAEGYARKKSVNKATIANQIIKFIEPYSTPMPSGKQIVAALVKYYELQGKYPPKEFYVKKTFHQINMTLSSVYRENHYCSLTRIYDSGLFGE